MNGYMEGRRMCQEREKGCVSRRVDINFRHLFVGVGGEEGA